MSGAANWIKGGSTYLPTMPPYVLHRLANKLLAWQEEYADLELIMASEAQLQNPWSTWYEFAPDTLDTYWDPSKHEDAPDGNPNWHYYFGGGQIPNVQHWDGLLAVKVRNVLEYAASSAILPYDWEPVWSDQIKTTQLLSNESVIYFGVVLHGIYGLYALEVARTLLHCFCVDLRTRGTKREGA